MTTLPEHYIDNPNMLLDLHKADFGKNNTRIQNSLINDGPRIKYLGELLLMSKSDFDEIERIGGGSQISIKKFLENLTSYSGQDYKLRDNNVLPYAREPDTQNNEDFVRKVFQLADNKKPIDIPVKINSATIHQPATEKGFCADEFRLISEDADSVEVRFKIELPQIFGDLVKHAHLCLDDMTRFNEGVEHQDEKVVCKETKATAIEYSPEGEEITLIYKLKNGGLTALSSLGMYPSQAMTNAANILTPIGQQRAMKRYGITKPTP